MPPSRRAPPERLPHEQAEVERARVDEQPLEDVLMPAQVGAAEPAGVVHVGKGALDVFAAAPHESLAAHAAHPPAIAVDRPLRVGRVGPLAAAPIRLGDIGAHADGAQSPIV